MKQFTAETRRRMSESAKRRCASQEWLASQHARAAALPEEDVRRMYEDGMTQTEIADALGVTQKVVWRFMKNHGINARVAAKRNQLMEQNDNWKGGRHVNDQGYAMVYCPSHPRAHQNGYVLEHVLVAEIVCGHELPSGYHVHHINGNKLDNRPDNLAVMTAGEHIAYHLAVKAGRNPSTPIAVTKVHFPEEEDESEVNTNE